MGRDLQAKLRADIAEYGWHVLLVLGEEDRPGFAYTVGLYHSYGHPEIIMFGLKHQTMHQVLNILGDEVKAGARFEPGQTYPEILQGYPIAIRRVDLQWYHEYLGQAIDFYGDLNFPAVQCVWPDMGGNFPWDPEFPEAGRRVQPVLERNSRT